MDWHVKLSQILMIDFNNILSFSRVFRVLFYLRFSIIIFTSACLTDCGNREYEDIVVPG